MNEELIKELINQLKVHNKLLSLFYIHCAENWDSTNDSLVKYNKDNLASTELLKDIKGNLQ